MTDAEKVREALSYNPITGEFHWLNCRKSCLNGEIAGCLNTAGYRVIRFLGTLQYGHRLAWLYMTGSWPDFEIDHRDLRKSNNAWDNLRLATHSENSKNTSLRSSNSSGHKGVYFNKRQSQWHASLQSVANLFTLAILMRSTLPLLHILTQRTRITVILREPLDSFRMRGKRYTRIYRKVRQC